MFTTHICSNKVIQTGCHSLFLPVWKSSLNCIVPHETHNTCSIRISILHAKMKEIIDCHKIAPWGMTLIVQLLMTSEGCVLFTLLLAMTIHRASEQADMLPLYIRQCKLLILIYEWGQGLCWPWVAKMIVLHESMALLCKSTWCSLWGGITRDLHITQYAHVLRLWTATCTCISYT